MNSSFYNAVVIITGSTQGIGLETGIQLLKQGAYVVFNGRRENPGPVLQTLLQKHSSKACYIAADVGNASAVFNLVTAVIKQQGKIDIVILNAGMSSQGYLHEHADGVIQNIINTNLFGALWLSKYAVPALQKTKGQILCISSAAALCGIAEYSLYSATKKALIGLAESLYSELFPMGIHVGVTIVGFTENETFKTALKPDGSLHPVPNRNAFKPMSRAATASCILQQLQGRRRIVVTGLSGKFAYVVSRWWPALYLRLLRRHYLKSKLKA